MKKNKPCSHCSVPSVKLKCVACDCTGKIEIPTNIVWINDLPYPTQSRFQECDNCDGKGWILVPPMIAQQIPENILGNFPS